ncbi:MAG TPA: sigma-54-dependent Fis family transcriptional regulator [Blastocatellia bacterium]|nr:sigma-54-dependent Fis family transcriptional regulator [Blastocatellia bacterium]
MRICQKLSAEHDLDALLDLIAREATRLIEADRASIFLLDEEKRVLWSQVALASEPIRFDARLGIAGAVALTGETIRVDDVRQDPRFYPGIDARTGYRTRNILAVPLRTTEGEIIGTFEVLNKKGGSFTPEDEELLKALAAHAAISIETARLVSQLREHRDRLLEENTRLWKEVEGKFATQNILGTDEKIQRVVRLIEQISDTTLTVLITGESGTGKELVARAIHYSSPRARGPFVALNCAALPEGLVETELFGIEKGVATGVERRAGKFEEAHGGTLFLDEIGDLSLPAQAKILRALQERVIERVGGRRPIPVDVRIVAATNKDLAKEITKGTFREDLYYRLKVIHIEMPPLREIRQDIPLLATHFLTTACREMGREPKKLSPGAIACLMSYSWPGNVRELENEMKRLAAMTWRRTITEDDLSENIRRGGKVPSPSVSSLKEAVAEIEKRMILEALQACRHNQQRAARMLGVSRQGLIKKMKRYGIR